MARSFQASFPVTERQTIALGERVRLARLRRKINATLMAERVGVSRDTLHRLEKGDPNIALGTWLRALRVLGLDKDIDRVAQDDVLGRKLQDLALLTPSAAKRSSDRGTGISHRGDQAALVADAAGNEALDDGRR